MVTDEMIKAMASELEAAAGKKLLNIFVFDDDADTLAYLTESIAQLGHNVWSASDPDSGIAAVRDLSTTLDYILMDVIMPSKSGLKTHMTLKEHGISVKTIFMTGLIGDELEASVYKEGGLFLLSKPFSRADLSFILR